MIVEREDEDLNAHPHTFFKATADATESCDRRRTPSSRRPPTTTADATNLLIFDEAQATHSPTASMAWRPRFGPLVKIRNTSVGSSAGYLGTRNRNCSHSPSSEKLAYRITPLQLLGVSREKDHHDAQHHYDLLYNKNPAGAAAAGKRYVIAGLSDLADLLGFGWILGEFWSHFRTWRILVAFSDLANFGRIFGLG